MNELIYNYIVRKNENVQYEYERYVKDNIQEHYSNRFKHWNVLFNLIWHYQIKKKDFPMIYFDRNSNTNVKTPNVNNKILNTKDNNAHLSSNNTKKDSNTKGVSNSSKTKNIVSKTTLSEYNTRLEPYYLAKNMLKYDVISFDVFDTLVLRPLKNPEDLFMLVGEKLDVLDFVNIRKSAERKLREKKFVEFGNREVTLDEIYAEIERKTGISAEFGKKIEIDTEYDLIYPNPYMKCVFDILKCQNKLLIATSDMYLPKDVIIRILEKCGYSFDEVFLSCEYHCSKRDMGLYKQVLNKYVGKQIVHIGDNYATDFENSKKCGFDSIFYRQSKYIGQEVYDPSEMTELVGSVYSGLVYNTLFNGIEKFNPYFEYGYVYGGIYVLGFCNWIKKQAKQDKVDKILFLSRDGYIYQKIFDMLNCDIESEYVYWSRIASVVYNMEYDKADLLKRLVDHKAVSVNKTLIKDVLNILNVSADEIKLQNYSISEDMLLCPENKYYLEEAINDNYNLIIKKNKLCFDKMKEYLSSVVSGYKKVAVVDVGWTGTGDLAIKNLIEKKYKFKCDVYCYLAASRVPGNVSNLTFCMNQKLKTYMFSQTHNRQLYNYHVVANKGTNCIYFELFTQACMPSFKGINESGEFEFDISEVENYDMIKEIHMGIKRFAKEYLKISEHNPILLEISGHDAYIPYKNISHNLEFFKKYFGEFSYARGVGGSGEMKIENIREIMSVKNL